VAVAPTAVARAAPEPADYVGLVTRVMAFAVDAVVINVVAIVTGAVIALFLSVISVPKELDTIVAAVGGASYVLWTIGYFVTFWSTTGQTPGNRLLKIRVVAAGGERLKPRRALLRFAGLTLAALPLFAGFLLILVDNRRRGLQDMLARTLVVEAEPGDPPGPPRFTRSPAPARR
jgi:uncharacterized RDD family membrane protein YckC